MQHTNLIRVEQKWNVIEARENEVREHIPVPYYNLFQSILVFAPRCEKIYLVLAVRRHARGMVTGSAESEETGN